MARVSDIFQVKMFKDLHQVQIQMGEGGNCMLTARPDLMVPNVVPPSHDDHFALLQCKYLYPSLIWMYQPHVLHTIGSVQSWRSVPTLERLPQSQHMVVL